MAKLTEFQKIKRKAATIRIYSQEKTKFPGAWDDALAHFANLSDKSRVMAFDLKVWLKPVERERTSQ